MITRDQALELLHKAETPPALMQHAIASEALMLALAKALGQDETVWALCGLLHDLDYPQTQHTPEQHGLQSVIELEGLLPEEALDALEAHNGEANGTPVAGLMAYALRCGESVTGLVIAAALVRPTGFEGMQASSLKKKMKDKAFAASVSRECIRECEKLGMNLDEFLSLAIEALAPHAAALGVVKG